MTLDSAAAARVDRLLWCLRFAPSRSAARQWVEAGHIRLNGRRVSKPSQMVRVGDVLTLPLASETRVIAVMAIPDRRVGASVAATCYRDHDRQPGENAPPGPGRH